VSAAVAVSVVGGSRSAVGGSRFAVGGSGSVSAGVGELRAGAVLLLGDAGCFCGACVGVCFAVTAADWVVVRGACLGAGLALSWFVGRAAFGGGGVLAEEARGAVGCAFDSALRAYGSGGCLACVLAQAPVADRYAMRMRDAVVAVVAPITAAHRRPLLRADRGLLRAFAGARDFAAVLPLGVVTKQTRLARGDRAAGTAASHWTRRDAWRRGAGTLARVSR